jgi:hypothetical protein
MPPDNINSHDTLSIPPYSNTTNVNAMRTGIPGTTIYSAFTFSSNGVPASGLPLFFCMVNVGTESSQQILTPSPTVTVTTFGPPLTGFIEGSFNIQMNFSGTPKNVVCNFRVRRS